MSAFNRLRILSLFVSTAYFTAFNVSTLAAVERQETVLLMDNPSTQDLIIAIQEIAKDYELVGLQGIEDSQIKYLLSVAISISPFQSNSYEKTQLVDLEIAKKKLLLELSAGKFARRVIVQVLEYDRMKVYFPNLFSPVTEDEPEGSENAGDQVIIMVSFKSTEGPNLITVLKTMVFVGS